MSGKCWYAISEEKFTFFFQFKRLIFLIKVFEGMEIMLLTASDWMKIWNLISFPRKFRIKLQSNSRTNYYYFFDKIREKFPIILFRLDSNILRNSILVFLGYLLFHPQTNSRICNIRIEKSTYLFIFATHNLFFAADRKGSIKIKIESLKIK